MSGMHVNIHVCMVPLRSLPCRTQGEPELALEAERRAHGIPVPGRTWHGFEKIAAKLGGITLPLSLEELAEQPVAKL
jgi:hypothetical protein